ncbi:helix-turn-helix domain-containing protein [Flavobacterium sp. TP390]|uniref:Helix-turn-helix domain-containing protein n=1 Tax=Flavobacterium profundi TaxID=1774945 RepID=A0A6I4ID96_9FLAO|nr:helix-turn-helix domain-containing protein [Flavobacterium profundi]MVO07548.1 helix-turn-helix domain-containing protein [Flavobacterium profundi]
MNKVKILREQKKLTQTELAEKSGISLRTIQRIESGSRLKGYTLNVIANALETEPQNLFFTSEKEISIERAKEINLSALAGLIIPFGGIILPFILTYNTKDVYNKQLGKNIVSIEIIITTLFSIALILCPFIQKYFSIKTPFFLYVIIIFLVLKLIIVIINGKSLNTKKKLNIKLKTNFL